jgi:hypothetical protein
MLKTEFSAGDKVTAINLCYTGCYVLIKWSSTETESLERNTCTNCHTHHIISASDIFFIRIKVGRQGKN